MVTLAKYFRLLARQNRRFCNALDTIIITDVFRKSHAKINRIKIVVKYLFLFISKQVGIKTNILLTMANRIREFG